MSLRAKSHADLTAAGSPSDGGLCRSFCTSSSNVTAGGGRLGGGGGAEDFKGPSRLTRRPVRAVRPLSADGSFLQINHLQGELVRKRKECEDLRKENKFLSNEIHMERIVMRTESELTMRNLRSLNQELQAQVKELKQKLCQSQQRAALCSRAAEEAEESRSEAERSRALAEARALGSQRDRGAAEADRSRLAEELQRLQKEHTDLQLSLTKAEQSCFETKLKLDRESGDKRALLQENRSLEVDRDDLRLKLRQITEDNVQIQQSEADSRRREAAAAHQGEQAQRARREAEAERRLAEAERRDRAAECLAWREKHRQLADRFREQEDLKALRSSKACQANIKSYFLCMTESDQRVKILKSQDGSPRNFTESDPVYISTPEASAGEPDRSSSRTPFRVAAPPPAGRDPGRFDELPAFGGERPDSTPPRRSRKVVEYFWIPTEQD
ncbi:uncharacterized abhydrolase domain-containing protein DDB_G0269086 [Pungitius pungitius]|uniref:uncharacterized abhydrolase domain-containing protein DDB_G0269086 n=1 Tax=Pungitius pungitius TaxID=134920 RepID=UPI002E0E67A1